MNAYGTYIWGKDAVLFDLPIWRAPYQSIWRVLHVDGFEPNLPSLPASDKKIRFYFDFETVPDEH